MGLVSWAPLRRRHMSVDGCSGCLSCVAREFVFVLSHGIAVVVYSVRGGCSACVARENAYYILTVLSISRFIC